MPPEKGKFHLDQISVYLKIKLILNIFANKELIKI